MFSFLLFYFLFHGNHAAMKVTLPDASKKMELKKSINLTINEELLQGAYCRKNCIIYISTRRDVVALTIIKVRKLFYLLMQVFCRRNFYEKAFKIHLSFEIYYFLSFV